MKLMNESLTVKRKKILDVINSASLPVSAKDVSTKLGISLNLATVYRGLQYLENKHLISGFTIVCTSEGTLRYYYKNKIPHEHFFHCEECHCFISFRDCSLDKSVKKFEDEKNCVVKNHVLYYTGLCEKCRDNKTDKKSCQH